MSPLWGFIVLAAGSAMVVTFSVVGYVTVPNIIIDFIGNEVALSNDTLQMERFEQVPFALNFNAYLFNITNVDEVMNGFVPRVQEVGPFVYKLYQQRVIVDMDDDTITYKILETYEFDENASYPRREDDLVTIVNVPYHALLQTADSELTLMMPVINRILGTIFGEHATPYATYRVKDLFFDGVKICESPGLTGRVVCGIIRNLASRSQNLKVLDDNTIVFSIFGHKNETTGKEFKVDRGLDNLHNLGHILAWDNSTRLNFWSGDEGINDEEDDVSVCNQLNGTDSGIFPPFVDTYESIYAFNPDICRSVELRFEKYDIYKDIPVVSFSTGAWFLDNDDECFCVNTTVGVIRPNGCLFKGAMELESCVGAAMVVSYPHFLYADFEYLNGVIGLIPNADKHKIFLDLEPESGTVVQGYKRAQFNIFARSINGIRDTNNLRTTLTPILWVEEGMSLPDEFSDEIKTRLLKPLQLVAVLRIVLIAFGALVVAVGVALILLRCIKLKTTSEGQGSTSQLTTKSH